MIKKQQARASVAVTIEEILDKIYPLAMAKKSFKKNASRYSSTFMIPISVLGKVYTKVWSPEK